MRRLRRIRCGSISGRRTPGRPASSQSSWPPRPDARGGRGNRRGGTSLAARRTGRRPRTSRRGLGRRRESRCPRRACEPRTWLPSLAPDLGREMGPEAKNAFRHASADSFQLEGPDHDRLIRELVRDPVVGLDLSQSDDLELSLLLVRLEVDRAVDHVLHGLEGLVVVHASLEGDRGNDLRLTEAVHEPLEEVHRVPLVCLGDRGAEGQVREPEVGILLLEFLVELAHDLVDVLEVRRAVHPPDVLLLHRFGGLERRRAVNPADEAELVVLDERRQDGRDVLRDVDRQLRRRDDDGGDALPQALRDEVEERDLFPDERGTDEEDVRIEGDAPVEQVVETRGPRLDTVRLLLDGDGLFRLRLAGRGRDAGLDGTLAHLEFLFLLVRPALEFLFSLAQPVLPRFELGVAVEVFHSRGAGGPALSGLPFQFERLELDVRLAFLEFLRSLEQAPVFLVQPLDLGLQVRLHLGDLFLPRREGLFLPFDILGVRPGRRLLHLRVFEKFRILLRLVIEATLRLFHGGGLAIDFRGSLPQGGLLVRDRLLAGNEFGLPVLERATLALELLVDPRRIFVALAELALQGLDLDLLLADFLLLRENLRLPILQLADPRCLAGGMRRLESLGLHAELRFLELEVLFLLQERGPGGIERLLELLEPRLAFLDGLELRLRPAHLRGQLDRGALDLLLALREGGLACADGLAGLLEFLLEARQVAVLQPDLLGLRLHLGPGRCNLPVELPELARALLDRDLAGRDVA